MRFQGVCLVEKYLFMHEKMTFLKDVCLVEKVFVYAHFEECHFLMHSQILLDKRHIWEREKKCGSKRKGFDKERFVMQMGSFY